jgi:hypothetical protein
MDGPIELDGPPLDVPDGYVVWADDDGRIWMEADQSSSPCSWPVEDDA